MNLDLICSRDDGRVFEQDFQVLDREIRHADGAHFACPQQFLHLLPRFDECRTLAVGNRFPIDGRLRPVHEIEVDVSELKLVQRLLERFRYTMVIPVRQLRSNEDILSWESRFVNGLSDSLFIEVPGSL